MASINFRRKFLKTALSASGLARGFFAHQASEDHNHCPRQRPATRPKLPNRRIQYQGEDQGGKFKRRQACCAINAEGQRQRQGGATSEKPIGNQANPIPGIGLDPFGPCERYYGQEKRA